MAIYEQYPRGAMLVSHTVPAGVTLPGDFVVGYMGAGLKRSTKFTDLIQYAADSHLPFLAHYAADPGDLLDQYQSLNVDHWKEAPPLTNWVINEVINPALMAGTAMRAVHGVILEMNKISRMRSDTGKVDEYPAGWILGTAEYLIWAIWQLYKLPVWVYMNPKTADAIAAKGEEAAGQMAAFLRKYGASTYLDVMTPGESITALPCPPDSAQALLRAAVAPTLGNAPGIEFWCYSTGDYSLTGVTGGVVPLFTYLGSRARLYDLLGWKETTPPPVDPPDDGNEGGGDGGTPDPSLAALLAAVRENGETLRAIAARLDAIAARMEQPRVTVWGDCTK